MEYANLTEKQSGALAAVLFQLLGASELLFKDLEAHFLRHNMELKQEQKKLASEFRRTATRMICTTACQKWRSIADDANQRTF